MRRIAATYDWQDPRPAHRCGPLVARTAGDRGRPVLLIHGLAASARTFGAAFDTLGARHRVLVPDLLGFGASPRPSTGFSIDEHVDAVIACVTAAGMTDQPAIVLGHSFGALVAVALRHRRPDLVGGLVLVSPPVYRTAAQARAITRAALTPAERLLAMDTRWAELACRNVCMRRPRLARRVAMLYRPELPLPIAIDGVRHSWPSYSESLAGLLAAEVSPDWIVEAGIPVHVITGLADRLPDLGLLRELARSSPLITLDELPGGDHLIPLSHARLCMAAVERLADSLEAAA